MPYKIGWESKRKWSNGTNCFQGKAFLDFDCNRRKMNSKQLLDKKKKKFNKVSNFEKVQQ